MRAFIRGLWLLLLLGAASRPLASPTVTIQFPDPGYDLYYVGDMDPRGDLTGVGNEIFVTLGITDPNPLQYDMQVQLSFGNAWLVRGRLVSQGAVSAGTYGPFSLNQIRQDQGLGQFRGVGGEFNDGFIDAISGNTLPAGTYTLRITFSQPVPTPPPAVASFTFYDPRRVDLLMPWDASRVWTDQPTFTWSGRARAYRLRVCEYDPVFHGSLLEAIESSPMWEAELSSTSVVYGLGGASARPLVDGRQYVWRVEALLSTTSGPRSFPSTLRVFRVEQGPGGGNQPDLANLLGTLTPGQLAGIAGLLEGYFVNGTILIDGRVVTREELEDLLRRLAAGELNIASIRIE